MVSYRYDWQWEEAERLLVDLTRRAPGRSAPYILYADFLLRVGRQREALKQNFRAIEISPINLATHSRLAATYYWTRQYHAAIRQVRGALRLDPEHPFNRHRLAEYLSITGRHEEALREMQSALSRNPGDPHFIGVLGYIQGISGRTDAAERTLTRLRRESRQHYVCPPI